MTAHTLPAEQLGKLVASDKNVDHHRLAKHYATHAIEHEIDAKQHETLALQYDQTMPQLAAESRHYAAHSMEAAEALRNLAAQHEKLGN